MERTLKSSSGRSGERACGRLRGAAAKVTPDTRSLAQRRPRSCQGRCTSTSATLAAPHDAHRIDLERPHFGRPQGIKPGLRQAWRPLHCPQPDPSMLTPRAALGFHANTAARVKSTLAQNHYHECSELVLLGAYILLNE